MENGEVFTFRKFVTKYFFKYWKTKNVKEIVEILKYKFYCSAPNSETKVFTDSREKINGKRK